MSLHHIAESAFDASGRPLEPAFFTGFPAYHNLIYELHQRGGQLDNLGLAIEPGQQQEEKPLKFWVKRKVMANILAEEISELQVCFMFCQYYCNYYCSASSPSTKTW